MVRSWLASGELDNSTGRKKKAVCYLALYVAIATVLAKHTMSVYSIHPGSSCEEGETVL